MNQPEDLQIEKLWKNYLELAKVKEPELPEFQRQEMKRAFMGGISQLLIVFHQRLPTYSEDEAAEFVQKMWKDLSDYWTIEVDKHAGKLN